MGGGCYSGPEGSACWGVWWVPLLLILVALAAAIIVVAGLVQLWRNPVPFFRYFASKRNLIVLPITFFGYMAIWTLGGFLVWQYRLPAWMASIFGVLAIVVVTIGTWASRRSRTRRP